MASGLAMGAGTRLDGRDGIGILRRCRKQRSLRAIWGAWYTWVRFLHGEPMKSLETIWVEDWLTFIKFKLYYLRCKYLHRDMVDVADEEYCQKCKMFYFKA